MDSISKNQESIKFGLFQSGILHIAVILSVILTITFSNKRKILETSIIQTKTISQENYNQLFPTNQFKKNVSLKENLNTKKEIQKTIPVIDNIPQHKNIETENKQLHIAKGQLTNIMKDTEIYKTNDQLKTVLLEESHKVIAEETEQKLEETEQKLEETEPKLEETEPKLEETEPKLEETEPKLEETEPKLEEILEKEEVRNESKKTNETNKMSKEYILNIEEKKQEKEKNLKAYASTTISNIFNTQNIIEAESNNNSALSTQVLNQIQKCWIKVKQSKVDIHGSIDINTEFSEDGSIISILEIEDKNKYSKEEQKIRHKIKKEASSAIQNCSPLQDMSISKYKDWRVVRFKFHY